MRVVAVTAGADLGHGRAAIQSARRLAGRALETSARGAGALLRRFARDADGAPLAAAGWHWSLSSTRGLVAALVAPAPVGIDVERLARPRLDAARRRLDELDPTALERMGGDRAAVLTLWTATEAVLKAARVGIAGLARCRLVERLTADRLSMTLDGTSFDVFLQSVGQHVAAVAWERGAELELSWSSLPEGGR
jgi:phosphopantetheinyl transferase